MAYRPRRHGEPSTGTQSPFALSGVGATAETPLPERCTALVTSLRACYHGSTRKRPGRGSRTVGIQDWLASKQGRSARAPVKSGYTLSSDKERLMPTGATLNPATIAESIRVNMRGERAH